MLALWVPALVPDEEDAADAVDELPPLLVLPAEDGPLAEIAMAGEGNVPTRRKAHIAAIAWRATSIIRDTIVSLSYGM